MNNTIPTLVADVRIKEILRRVARQLWQDKQKFMDWDLKEERYVESLSAGDDFAAALVRQFEHELLQERIEDATQVELGRIRALVGAVGSESTFDAVQRSLQDSKRVMIDLENKLLGDPIIQDRLQVLELGGCEVFFVG